MSLLKMNFNVILFPVEQQGKQMFIYQVSIELHDKMSQYKYIQSLIKTHLKEYSNQKMLIMLFVLNSIPVELCNLFIYYRVKEML